MLRLKQTILGELDTSALGERARLAQRRTPAPVLPERVNAPVDVDRRIAPRRTGIGDRDLEVGVSLGLQHLGDVAQHRGPPSVAEGSQACASGLPRVCERTREVDAFVGYANERRASHRVMQGLPVAPANGPAAADVVFEHLCHLVSDRMPVNSIAPSGSRYSTSARPSRTVGK